MPDVCASTTAGLHVPVMPLLLVSGKAGTLLPAQIVWDVPNPKIGITLGVTVTVNVAGKTQEPGSGVNVYMLDAWLSTTAGDQLPLIPFDEMLVNTGTIPFAQITIDVPKSKTGVMFGVTVTVKLAGTAHCPFAGVKVYVAEAWLSTTAGFHAPVTPLSDVFGNAGAVPFSQMDMPVPKLKSGTSLGITVKVNDVGVAHCPAAGVKVYTAELRLSTIAGFQVPVIPLFDKTGRDGTASPSQMVSDAPKSKLGAILGEIFTVSVVGIAQGPLFGVKV